MSESQNLDSCVPFFGLVPFPSCLFSCEIPCHLKVRFFKVKFKYYTFNEDSLEIPSHNNPFLLFDLFLCKATT